ncbi:MAG: Tim44 domain-containing protein [Caldimonas sp.]
MLRRPGLRRWGQGLSLGLGLPLLLGAAPAAAAGSAAVGVTGLTAGLGLLAALWAVLGARGAPVGASGLAAVAMTVLVLASAVLAWRRQQGRVAPAALRVAPRSLFARRSQLAIPAGLDGEQVLDAVRGGFVRLQAAWDAADVATLKALTTPEMLEELLHVLSVREAGASRTDVISLHAELLGLEELGAAYLASVEFSGLIRESAEQGAVPFRELWMLACTKDGTASWRLARQQALL